MHVGLLGRDIYASHRTETYSAMVSRPPVLLDPWQGAVGRNRATAVKDALRPGPRKFDTRPVSVNLHDPAAMNGPEKSAASAERAIVTAAEQGPSIPA
jgi:hypothetical protein